MGEDAVSKLVSILLEAPITIVEIDGLQLAHSQLRYQYGKVYQQFKLKEREEKKVFEVPYTRYYYTA